MSTRRPGVLFLVNSLRIGGAERHVVTLLNSLDTSVFRLALAYLKPDETLLPQLHTQRLQGILSCGVTGRLDMSAVRKIAAQLDELEIDVLVCTNNYAMLYGLLALRKARRPVKLVHVYHTTILQSAKERLQAAFYKPLTRRCDLLVYVCNNQRQHWRNRGLRARRDVVIHNGIDTERFTDSFTPAEKQACRASCGFSADDYVIGVCAVLRPEKAHTDVLEAIQRLRSSGIPARGMFIGDGPERGRIEARIAAMGLQGQIKITGFQSDVRPFIAACDVMTLASHAIETFSLSALEAMSLGKPLVLTDIGGASEQVEPGVSGFLFQPGDIEALTRHLAELRTPAKRLEMGAAAARSVRNRFTVATMSNTFSKELLTLAG